MTILFDSTRRVKVSGFGIGLGRPTDRYGNPLRRVGYTADDAAWWAAQNIGSHDLDVSTDGLLWDQAASESEAERRVETLGYL